MHKESIKNLEFDIFVDQVLNSCNGDISKLRLKNSELIYRLFIAIQNVRILGD